MDRHPSSALVFISYSSANRPVAEAACESLETNGIRCWIAPRNVDPGVPYAGQIIQGLRESKAVVLLFSDHANRSANVLREIEFATNNRAYAHYCLKQYDACITDATEAIRLDPKLSLAFSNRGDGYVGLKQYKTGIEDFTQAIRLNPNLTNAYIDRGYTHLQLKEYDACIADCTEALRINPNLPLAYNNRGYAYICLKQYDLGIADCSEAITLDPNLALAYLNRAFGYQQVGEIQKAKADRAKGEQLKEGNPGLDRPPGR